MKRLAIAIIPLLALTVMLGAFGCNKAATPTPTPTPVALFLNVTQPQDGSTTNTATITVSGSTTPGAVVSVSVNAAIYLPTVDAEGNFTIAVPLEEGPNLIEVVASDNYGNQQSATVSIVYTM